MAVACPMPEVAPLTMQLFPARSIPGDHGTSGRGGKRPGVPLPAWPAIAGTERDADCQREGATRSPQAAVPRGREGVKRMGSVASPATLVAWTTLTPDSSTS